MPKEDVNNYIEDSASQQLLAGDMPQTDAKAPTCKTLGSYRGPIRLLSLCYTPRIFVKQVAPTNVSLHAGF